MPDEEELDEYFFLFRDNDKDMLFNKKLHLMGNYEESISFLKNHKKMFNDYNAFLRYAMQQNESSRD